MAAVQINQNTGQKRFQLSATPGTCQEFILPIWAKRVSIFPETSDVQFALAGTDGGAIGADYVVVPGDGTFTRAIRGDNDDFEGVSIFIASASASVFVSIVAESI